MLSLFHVSPTTFWLFFSQIFIQGGSNHTLNLSFVITEHLKLVSGQKKISYDAWKAAKVGWVVDFLLRFASKLVVILLYMK